jgi:hypothetical protein
MISDSVPESRFTLGAMRMPPRAASAVPMAQLNSATRSGRAPLSRASERSSTLARMETPMRVR